jgi:hypothetical protein
MVAAVLGAHGALCEIAAVAEVMNLRQFVRVEAHIASPGVTLIRSRIMAT